MKTNYLGTLSILFLFCLAISCSHPVDHPAPVQHDASAPRPNIILILADDMGFSDIGCYGGEICTPNLDQLAARGLRFTQFYNAGRCCPTRACLLTGLYPHQTGVGHMMNDQELAGYRGDLNEHCVTIAEVLRTAGYAAYVTGKWHVTRFTRVRESKQNWPLQRGFQRFFGTLDGAGNYYGPTTLTRANEQIEPFTGFFYTDAINNNAARFIRQHVQREPNQPFFLYVAHAAPHWPLHAHAEDIAKYRGTYLRGWDVLRAERHARMVELGIVDKAWPMTDRDSKAVAWDKIINNRRKEEMDLRMAIYAAQIERMDQGIGSIVETLKRTNTWDNTLIMFLSDNGACAEGGRWGFPEEPGDAMGEGSSWASYGLSWANASNTPFRLYKHYVHEGGIATPLIVHWPQVINAKGELRHQVGHVIDLMATCVHVSGAQYPTTFKRREILPMEGTSLVPAFANEPMQREAIYWEHEGNRAVRLGKWKLVAKGRRRPWELYDLEADRTETVDLANEQSEVVARLAHLWNVWAERTNVLPWPKQYLDD